MDRSCGGKDGREVGGRVWFCSRYSFEEKRATQILLFQLHLFIPNGMALGLGRGEENAARLLQISIGSFPTEPCPTNPLIREE